MSDGWLCGLLFLGRTDGPTIYEMSSNQVTADGSASGSGQYLMIRSRHRCNLEGKLGYGFALYRSPYSGSPKITLEPFRTITA